MRLFTALLLLILMGCSNSFQEIDTRVESLMQETSGLIRATEPHVPENGDPFDPLHTSSESPTTVNPTTDELSFVPAEAIDAASVALSLDNASDSLNNTSRIFTLNEALLWANVHAREMRFAEYDYLYTTLSLLSELHLWGPRFSNTISADIDADSSGGLYDTSLQVVNDFSVSKKLPYGGSVSASALTEFSSMLHSASTSSDDSATTLDLTLEIPLLKDSGVVARESLIQARRDMVYGARTFERFRRTFYREIVGDYLALVVQKQSLENAQRSVDSLRQLANRQAALYDAGRTRFYDSVDAENQALAAVARLSQSWESYRLALDRFKIRIGFDIKEQIEVVQTSIGVFPPLVDAPVAVEQALSFRLDLQNEYDRLVDTKRDVNNAIYALLPDVSLTASTSLISEADKPIGFDGKDFDYTAGLSVSLPLDKDDERIIVRQNQITLEKAKRSYRETRDEIAVAVRSALRNIEVFQFTHDLQVRNVEIAQLGLDSINADPDRVSVLDQTRAISDLQSAQDARDSAKRDLDLSILDYLLQAGQLRTNQQGELILPSANSK